MADQTVELQPSESKVVTFEAIPHEAKVYAVHVNGLSGSFRAIELPLRVEVSRLTLDSIGGQPENIVGDSTIYGIYQSPKVLLKRERDYRDISEQSFSFSVKYINNLDYDVFLHPLFAFGSWAGGSFTPFSPQEDILEVRPFGFEKHYAMKDDYIRLGGMESAFTARNMTNKISPTLYMSRAYLKVPAGGTAETGFDGIRINYSARSKRVEDDEMEGWQPKTPPFLALFVTRFTKLLSDWKEAVEPPVQLDMGIHSEVFRYVRPEGSTYGSLVNTGLTVWAGLIDAVRITNAWGTWSSYVSGHTNYMEWAWVDLDGNPTSPPAWWEA